MLKLRTLLIAALCASVVTFSPTPHEVRADPAPDAASLEEAKKHFADGQKLFDAGDMKGAVEEFKEAYKLTKNPLLLYNIGYVYDKLDDASLSLHYYEKFLTDAPESPKTHEHRVEVEGRVAELRRANKGDSQGGPEGGSPDVAPVPDATGKHPVDQGPPVTGLVHEVIDEAPPGRPVDVVVQVPINQGWAATLYFRGGGEDVFSAIAMKPHYSELVGRIPAGAVKGTSVHYYVEAKDRKGKIVGSSGKSGSPNIIYLDPNAPPHFFADGTESVVTTPSDSETPGGGNQSGEESPLAPQQPRTPGSTTADTSAHSKLFYPKWIASGGAVVFLGAGLIFYLQAKSYSNTLEGEAEASTVGDGCAMPPCRAYTGSRKDLESTGQRYQTLSNVGLVLGGVSLVTAGVLWYLDMKHETSHPNKVAPDQPRVTAAPVVGEGFVGGAALVTF